MTWRNSVGMGTYEGMLIIPRPERDHLKHELDTDFWQNTIQMDVPE